MVKYGKLPDPREQYNDLKMKMAIHLALFFSCPCSFPLQFEIQMQTCFNSCKNLRLNYLKSEYPHY